MTKSKRCKHQPKKGSVETAELTIDRSSTAGTLLANATARLLTKHLPSDCSEAVGDVAGIYWRAFAAMEIGEDDAPDPKGGASWCRVKDDAIARLVSDTPAQCHADIAAKAAVLKADLDVYGEAGGVVEFLHLPEFMAEVVAVLTKEAENDKALRSASFDMEPLLQDAVCFGEALQSMGEAGNEISARGVLVVADQLQERLTGLRDLWRNGFGLPAT